MYCDGPVLCPELWASAYCAVIVLVGGGPLGFSPQGGHEFLSAIDELPRPVQDVHRIEPFPQDPRAPEVDTKGNIVGL